MTNNFLQRLALTHPIIQAPLAGGADTPELVSAVGEAGGLGFMGAGYLTPEQISAYSKAVRAKTSRPFGINLFAPQPTPAALNDMRPILDAVTPFYAELGLEVPDAPKPAPSSFPAQLAAALECGASVFSFTFGMLPAEAVVAVKARNLYLIGTATTVTEALALENSGVDAVVAQGSEAGGHRGTFAADFAVGMIGTIALVPQIADAIKIPVIASGGIMDGRGIAAALALGASAVQMGTAFLTCDESGVPESYKDAILSAREDQTRITRAFSGRPARGIVNRFMSVIDSQTPDEAIPPFPIHNALTRPLRNAAAKQNRAEYLNLWSGQAPRLARRQSAGALMQRLARETAETISRLSRI